eukprot:scaffold994_cov396-Pavlova_lutheri.AAC.9
MMVHSSPPSSEKILPPPVVSSLGRDRRDWVTPSQKIAVVGSLGVSEGTSREKCGRLLLCWTREPNRRPEEHGNGNRWNTRTVKLGTWFVTRTLPLTKQPVYEKLGGTEGWDRVSKQFTTTGVYTPSLSHESQDLPRVHTLEPWSHPQGIRGLLNLLEIFPPLDRPRSHGRAKFSRPPRLRRQER